MRILLPYLLILACGSVAVAGDYFSYRPKKLTYEFASPFDDPASPKLPPAKLHITTQPDEKGRYWVEIKSAPLASIEVELGKKRLNVPKQLLSDLGPLDLNTLDFYWVAK